MTNEEMILLETELADLEKANQDDPGSIGPEGAERIRQIREMLENGGEA